MAAASKTVWAGNLPEEATLKEPTELGPQNGTPAWAEKTKDTTELNTFQTAEEATSVIETRGKTEARKRGCEEAPSLPPWRRRRPLPPFWSEEWSEKHQLWYYWNRQTKFSQWERPWTRPSSHYVPK